MCVCVYVSVQLHYRGHLVCVSLVSVRVCCVYVSVTHYRRGLLEDEVVVALIRHETLCVCVGVLVRVCVIV